MPRISTPAAVLVAGLAATGAAPASGSEAPRLAITLYSSAQPGGIPAEWYRPLPGMGTLIATQLPGYAMVRDDRVVRLDRARSTLRVSDVAALIDPTTNKPTRVGVKYNPDGSKVLVAKKSGTVLRTLTDKPNAKYAKKK